MNTSLLNEINKSSLVDLNYSVFNYFYVMLKNEELTDMLLESCLPQPSNVGSKYALTLLGSLFNLSILPKVPMGKCEYFQSPMDQVSIFYTIISTTNMCCNLITIYYYIYPLM